MQRSNRCPDTRALLPAYVEGDLDGPEARGVRGHLEICAACRAEEAACRAAMALLNAPEARQPRPHGDLYAGFAARLARQETRGARRQTQLRWAAALGCMAVVATAGASYLPGVVHRLTAPAPVRVAVQPAPDVVAQAPPVRPARKVQTPPATAAQTPRRDVAMDTEQRDPFAPVSPDTAAAPPATHGAGHRAPRHRTDAAARVVNAAARAGSSPDADREEFWHVKAANGLAAGDIIRYRSAAQGERPVAEARPGATHPVVTAAAPVPSHGTTNVPSVSDHHPADPTETATFSGPQPDVVLPVDSARVRVNGTTTDVESSVGLDKRGKPVLVNVNIGRGTKTRPLVSPGAGER